jgi:hypothetical protein
MMDRDEAIARLVFAAADRELPPWLVAAVRKARETLAWIIRQERAYPGRKVLRRRLEALAAAAEFVRRETRDIDMAMLLRAGDSSLPNERETYQGLGDLAERVRKALDAVPERQGQDKYFGRPNGATPQQNCALMVSILWEEVHSKAPPNTNANAQEACAKLWAGAGGPVRHRRKSGGKVRMSSGSASTEVWRDHLREAKRGVGAEEAEFLIQSLVPGPEPMAEDRRRLRY